MTTAQPVVNEEVNFDDAFKEAVAASSGEEVKPVEKTAEQIAAEAKTAADAKAAEEAAAKAAEVKAAEDVKAVEEAAAKAKANEGKTAEQIAAEEKAVEAIAAADKAKAEAAAKAVADAAVRSDAEARVRAEAAAKQKLEDDAKAKVIADAKAAELNTPYEPSEEEKAAMKKFQAEFPNEYVAVEARLKSVDREIQRRIHVALQDTMAKVGAVVGPLAKGYAEDAASRHELAIRAAHTDTDEIVNNIPAWINKQPSYLKAAYDKVMEDGSTQEVIDLFSRFKQETKPATTPAPVTKPGLTEEEIAAGAPVSGRRASPAPRSSAPDKADFDGAFAEAAKAAK